MADFSKYNEILIYLRTSLFSGEEFTDDFIKVFKNKYKNQIKEQDKDLVFEGLIKLAKNDLIELPVQKIQFSKIKSLMDLVDGISRQFQIPEQAEKYSESKQAFDQLTRQFRRGVYDEREINSYIATMQKDAKAWENNDQKYKLFEELRKYSKMCETLIIPTKDDNTRMLLSPDLVGTVLTINSGVSKIGFNVITYRELSERCIAENPLLSIAEEKRFPIIITLIALKCKSLSVSIPYAELFECPSCSQKISHNVHICPKCGDVVKCDSCGVVVGKGTKKCKGCGKSTENIRQSLLRWSEKVEEEEIKSKTIDIHPELPTPDKGKNLITKILIGAVIVGGAICFYVLKTPEKEDRKVDQSVEQLIEVPAVTSTEVPVQQPIIQPIQKTASPEKPKEKSTTTTTPKKEEKQPVKEEPKLQQEIVQPPVKSEIQPNDMTPDEACQTGKSAAKQSNYAKAVKYYQSAADRGIVIAAYDLALLYQQGRGVSKNAEGAFKYMKMAAEAGHTNAFRMLGEMYHGGRGVVKNRSIAEKWYKKAADTGDEKAKKLLYNM